MRGRKRGTGRVKALKDRLRIALAQNQALHNRLEQAEQKQRRAETLLVGFKSTLLEAIRR